MPLIDSVTMVEFEEGLKKSKTVILPCGSIEEHGPHLPLGTDTWHAYELAKAASNRMFLWVAPPLFYGLCRSTSKHPGTISIRGTTLRTLIQDIIKSFHTQGLQNILVLSGHGGGTHLAMIVDACEEVMELIPNINCAVVSVLDLGKKVWQGLVETPKDAHAGEVETSIIMHIAPACVKGAAVEDYPSFPEFLLVRDKKRYWPTGIWGNPAKASTEKGRILLERAAEVLVDTIRLLEAGKYK